MLKKRIIPCLDIREGRTVKGVNFVALRDAGDPVELAAAYAAQGADELCLLDITATVEDRGHFTDLVQRVAKAIDIPFTVGGGIRQGADVEALLAAGADKVSINSAAVRNPELISDLAAQFGSQCVVVAIDAQLLEGNWWVTTHGGRTRTPLEVVEWAKEAEARGAGELLLTSMQADGTQAGFSVELTKRVAEAVRIPVIASGGAGNSAHFADVFREGLADAALAASVFHFGQIAIPDLKKYLKTRGIAVRD